VLCSAHEDQPPCQGGDVMRVTKVLLDGHVDALYWPSLLALFEKYRTLSKFRSQTCKLCTLKIFDTALISPFGDFLSQSNSVHVCRPRMQPAPFLAPGHRLGSRSSKRPRSSSSSRVERYYVVSPFSPGSLQLGKWICGLRLGLNRGRSTD
jgi:hypothetical protein